MEVSNPDVEAETAICHISNFWNVWHWHAHSEKDMFVDRIDPLPIIMTKVSVSFVEMVFPMRYEWKVNHALYIKAFTMLTLSVYTMSKLQRYLIGKFIDGHCSLFKDNIMHCQWPYNIVLTNWSCKSKVVYNNWRNFY